METETYQLLEQGFAAAFINRNISSNLAYKPQFVSNDYRQGKKVLSSIEDELFRVMNLRSVLRLLRGEGLHLCFRR